ncbi:hypothetical protein CHLNCDRAFT_133927 [Chlorella variabilis]|uniref:Uncharacterized protein n=1 Tax=Chlorella variabilis TaxID=554065 RepID=E1ZEL3_CHLVA|nr:hypothetical protein CHLNCDRAFT_133927 [Chlorella variabilis]EFN55515.1 hypothetical protein CHLNCDRAFT_133927 [Chlorella variabilis]|eukprot:XP_005847617.1 hypothetical protein CHLNCDRAFT_133927 [Chlorella variabilis]
MAAAAAPPPPSALRLLDDWPAGEAPQSLGEGCVDFTAACDQHDLCYRVVGADKGACDKAFLDALLAECDRALRCVAADVPIPGDVLCGEGGGGGNPLRGACASLAQLYFEGVDRLAGDAFQIDQEEQKQHVAQCQAGAR